MGADEPPSVVAGEQKTERRKLLEFLSWPCCGCGRSTVGMSDAKRGLAGDEIGTGGMEQFTGKN